MSLPTDSQERKDIPMAEGFLYYFPDAIAEAAKVSKKGNDKHNPGEPMHHARGKSNDHADCIMRHLTDAGRAEGEEMIEHLASLFWRSGAMLQEALEKVRGYPLPKNAR